jgi:hypothetical protein
MVFYDSDESYNSFELINEDENSEDEICEDKTCEEKKFSLKYFIKENWQYLFFGATSVAITGYFFWIRYNKYKNKN